MSDILKPFAAACYDTPSGPLQTYYTGTVDRIAAVKKMTDRATLEAVLQIPDLQKSVADATHRRLRQLGLIEVPE